MNGKTHGKSGADGSNGTGNTAAGEDDLSHRLDALGARIDRSRVREEGKNRQDDGSVRSGVGQAMRLSSEFIAGVVVGAGIGYGIDYFAGTSPWGLIVFLLLGFVAAVLNVLRASGLVAESGMRVHKDPD